MFFLAIKKHIRAATSTKANFITLKDNLALHYILYSRPHIFDYQIYFLLTVCYYQVMYAFQSESTLHSYLNVKELLAGTSCDIWYLSVSNEIRTHNHLVCKRTLNHLAKWLSVRLRTKWLWVRIPLLSLNFCFWITLVLLTLVHLELHFWK